MFHLVLLFLQSYIFDKRFCIFFLTKYDTRKVFKINTLWQEDKHHKKRKQFTTHYYEHLILNSPIKCQINRRPLNCWYLIFYQGSWLFLLSPKRMMRIMKVRTMTSRKVTITATMLQLASSTWKKNSQFVSPLIWIFRASWPCFFDLRVIWFDEIRFGFLSIEIVLVYQKSMFPLWQVFVFLTAKRFFSMPIIPCIRCFRDTTSMFFLVDVNVRSFR